MTAPQENAIEGQAAGLPLTRDDRYGPVLVSTERALSDRLAMELGSSVIAVIDLVGTNMLDLRCGRQSYHGSSEPMSALVLPQNRLLDFAWSCDRPGKACVVVNFGETGMQLYAPELLATKRRLHPSEELLFRPNPTMANLAWLVAQQLSAGTAPDPMFVETALQAMAVATVAHVNPDTELRPATKLDPRLKRAVDYIEAGYATPISLLELSTVSGLSPSHLTLMFQREFGRSPHAYLIERRLTAAMREIKHSSEPLARIACGAGFVDQSHMTRAFRARFGCTPAQYRREVLRLGN